MGRSSKYTTDDFDGADIGIPAPRTKNGSGQFATPREAPPFKELDTKTRQWAHLRCDRNVEIVTLTSKIRETKRF